MTNIYQCMYEFDHNVGKFDLNLVFNVDQI